MRYLILSLIILLGLSSPAISGTKDPNTPDSKHLAYGAKHECVVPVQGEMKFKEKDGEEVTLKFNGSGVIIKKRICAYCGTCCTKSKRSLHYSKW